MLEKIKLRPFTLVVLFSGLTVASITAWFSVFGISSLYKGSKTAASLLAGSLELSKLTLASYAKRQWSTIGKLKYVIVPAILILILITSFGVYGFLINAYQSNSKEFSKDVQQKQFLEKYIASLETDLDSYIKEKESLVTNRQHELDKMVIDSTTRYLDNKQRQRIYDRWSPNIAEVETSIKQKRTELDSSRSKLLDLDNRLVESGAEVGPLVYIADAIFSGNLDLLVNWFTFLLVTVGDPIAVVLIILFNHLSALDKEYYESKNKKEPRRKPNEDQQKRKPRRKTSTRKKTSRKKPLVEKIEEETETVTEKKDTPEDSSETKTEKEPEKAAKLKAVLEEIENEQEQQRKQRGRGHTEAGGNIP